MKSDYRPKFMDWIVATSFVFRTRETILWLLLLEYNIWLWFVPNDCVNRNMKAISIYFCIQCAIYENNLTDTIQPRYIYLIRLQSVSLEMVAHTELSVKLRRLIFFFFFFFYSFLFDNPLNANFCNAFDALKQRFIKLSATLRYLSFTDISIVFVDSIFIVWIHFHWKCKALSIWSLNCEMKPKCIF